jgi:hypothetical protein
MVRVRSILAAAGALARTAVPAVANHPADFVKALTPWFANDDAESFKNPGSGRSAGITVRFLFSAPIPASESERRFLESGR